MDIYTGLTPAGTAMKRGVARSTERTQVPSYYAFLGPVSWASLGARVYADHLPDGEFLRCKTCRRRPVVRRHWHDRAMSIFYGDTDTGAVHRTWVSEHECALCAARFGGS
jgi:hypothetical protein